MRCCIAMLLCLISFTAGATNKYWGGNGNSNDANHWFTDSTFSTTTTVPGAGDNVYFTKAAGSVTMTLSATFYCLDLNMHGWSGVIGNSAGHTFRTYGNVYLLGTYTGYFYLYFMNTSGTTSFSSNGFSPSYIYRYGAGGTTIINDNIEMAGRIRMYAGTLNFNNKNISVTYIVIDNATNPSGIITGTANITLTSPNGLDFETNGSNFTFTGTGSTIHLTSSNAATVFKGNGKIFNNVYFDGTTGGAVISGNNTFNELKFAPSSGKTYQFTDGSTQTVTNFNAIGSFGKHITLTGTSTGGWTLSKSSGTVNCDWLKLSYSTVTGGATWNAGINSCNVSGNSGWDFTRPGYIVNGYIAY